MNCTKTKRISLLLYLAENMFNYGNRSFLNVVITAEAAAFLFSYMFVKLHGFGSVFVR